MALAIFDLDNTLLAGDSDHAWGEFMVEQDLVDAQYRRQNDQFLEDYRAGHLDVLRYLEFSIEPLSRYDPDALARLHTEFMQAKIRPMYLDKAASLLETHRKQGDRLLVMTSTNRFIIEPIVRELGIQEFMATELEMRQGWYTGRIIGEPCFQVGKVKRLRTWLDRQQETMAGSWFYSDSINDLPLLEWVEHPVAVDPDASLRRTAENRNWPVISLR